MIIIIIANKNFENDYHYLLNDSKGIGDVCQEVFRFKMFTARHCPAPSTHLHLNEIQGSTSTEPGKRFSSTKKTRWLCLIEATWTMKHLIVSFMKRSFLVPNSRRIPSFEHWRHSMCQRTVPFSRIRSSSSAHPKNDPKMRYARSRPSIPRVNPFVI